VSITDVTCKEPPQIYHQHLVNLYGCRLGKDVRIGAFVEIQKGARIGDRVKVSSHSFICEGVTIEDDVFIGHNVNFINDPYPRSSDGERLLSNDDWTVMKTLVKKGASIGTGSTIMCGVTIGEGALIGANSLVTKNVGKNEVWYGNPAKFRKSLTS